MVTSVLYRSDDAVLCAFRPWSVVDSPAVVNLVPRCATVLPSRSFRVSHSRQLGACNSLRQSHVHALFTSATAPEGSRYSASNIDMTS